MGELSVSQFFRQVKRYHGIETAESSGGVVIVNNNGNTGFRPPKASDGKLVKIALTIPLVVNALFSLIQGVKLLSPMVRPFNYFAHASALSVAKEFNDRSDIKKARESGRNPADTLTCELAEMHESIASHNTTRSKGLLLSATVIIGSGVVGGLMWRGKMEPHPMFGIKEVQKAMGISALFGLLCTGWHKLRAPTFDTDSRKAIIDRAYPKGCSADKGTLRI
jgi:hypothetical protein